MIISEVAQSHESTAQYVNRLPVKTVHFADLPLLHQQAIVVYMWEGAWEHLIDTTAKIVPHGTMVEQVRKAAVEKYGQRRVGYGTFVIDEAFKRACVRPLQLKETDVEKAFDQYHNWYVKNNSFKGHLDTYTDPWPVILSSPRHASDDGPLQDGWHRLHFYWIQQRKGKDPIPFVKYIDQLY